MKKLMTFSAGLILASFVWSGCVVAIGDNPAPAKPSVGQQLTDLKKAKDNGAISEEEYASQKQKLLAR